MSGEKPDFIRVQNQIRENSMRVRDYIDDLNQWQEEIKTKDVAISKDAAAKSPASVAVAVSVLSLYLEPVDSHAGPSPFRRGGEGQKVQAGQEQDRGLLQGLGQVRCGTFDREISRRMQHSRSQIRLLTRPFRPAQFVPWPRLRAPSRLPSLPLREEGSWRHTKSRTPDSSRR